MTIQSIPADDYRAVKTSWIWIATFVIVVFILGVLDPVQAVAYLIENGGIGEEGASALAFVAGYTLPLTFGFFVIIYLVLTGRHQKYQWYEQLIGAAVILYVSALIAGGLNLGLMPSFGQVLGGPAWLSLPVYVLTGYLTTYGIELMICALAIGTASAFHVERWLHDMSQAG